MSGSGGGGAGGSRVSADCPPCATSEPAIAPASRSAPAVRSINVIRLSFRLTQILIVSDGFFPRKVARVDAELQRVLVGGGAVPVEHVGLGVHRLAGAKHDDL